MAEGTSEYWVGISGRLMNRLELRGQLQGVRLLAKGRIQSASFGCAVPSAQCPYKSTCCCIFCKYPPSCCCVGSCVRCQSWTLKLIGHSTTTGTCRCKASPSEHNPPFLPHQGHQDESAGGLGMKYHANVDENLGGDE